MQGRLAIAALSLSASALVGIALHEGFRPDAYLDSVGVPTIGFGTTGGVRLGDRVSPERALIRLLEDSNKFERGLKNCIKVPLYQHEYDAILSWTYNVGVTNACNSTLVKLLNASKYEEACNQLTRWVYADGKKLPGLVTRREKERKQCLGLGNI